MLRISIIDDEHLALQYLDLQLSKIEGVHVTGKFMDAKDLISHVQAHKVDAVFLDIRMPYVKGTDLAKQLLNINPSLYIVFVTAYNEYGAEAFEINAVDYMLKPVKQERLAVAVQRIKEKQAIERNMMPDKSTSLIKDLGMLQIYQGDIRADVKWRTSKAKELFAYFIHNHGKTILKRELIELLWSNLFWEKANAQLYSAIYQIRKTLQQIDAPIEIISQEEFYQIDMDDDVQIQSHQFKVAAQRLLTEKEVDMEQYFMVLEWYQGDYLAGLGYSWAVNEREELKELWLELIDRLTENLPLYQKTSSYNVAKLKRLTGFDTEAEGIIKDKCGVV
ncbi:response regulator [Oceanobacillus timonensis]|uniref:response regulator n=1 Tax=Oceanobacillus timonensis TaxID=1926285 RepID=UPI0009BA2FF8|nr:response regulator [Oceanobacillus timonensis]